MLPVDDVQAAFTGKVDGVVQGVEKEGMVVEVGRENLDVLKCLELADNVFLVLKTL